MKTVARVPREQGRAQPFSLNYRPSHEATQPAIDAEQTLAETENELAQMVRAAAPIRDAGTMPSCAR